MNDIELKNVCFAYDKNLILDSINLKVEAGDFICLLGPTGSGKSSLLRLIAGLSKPTSGQVLINGKEVIGPGLNRGIVFQDCSLFPWLNTCENIILALEQAFPDKKHKELKEIATKELTLVGLANEIHKMPGELSGGMKQRAAIARAFAITPPILLMDEPFGAVDAITRMKLQALLLKLWQTEGERRKTIIFITHDVDEALLLANRVVILGLMSKTINNVCTIDIPRPRFRNELSTNSRFASLRNQLVKFLYQDLIGEAAATEEYYFG